MATSRPGLTDLTGHAEVVTQTTLTNEQIVELVETTSDTKKQEIIVELGELPLPTTTPIVSTFNGLTGNVFGVSSINGLTGDVSIGSIQGATGATGPQGLQGATGATGPVGDYVISFNGLTGAVTGVTVGGANTFTALQTFNSGITTSFLFASTGSTFGSTLQVNGGTTLASTLDVTGVARFAGGISASGGITFGGTVASDTGYRITSNAINAQTGTTYTFLSTDNGKIVTFNNASAVTVTIPVGLPVGFNCTGIQLGVGQVGFTAASGLTMQSYGNQYKLIGQHASATVIEYTTNIVNLAGNLIV